jgi:acyl phosphate:glycerol-3-phosphate acyltransferase
MSANAFLIVAFVIGYLLGSIPFGLILTRFAGTQDLRSIGSGNIGATNVLRTGRKGLAAATLICDMLKGTLAVLISGYYGGPDAAMLAALGAFLGHLFPIWLGFKGGKGVATFLGVLLAAAWPVGIGACLTWLVVAKLLKISSLSALAAAALSPLYALGLQRPLPTVLLAAVLAVLIFIRHHQNIRRLLAGTEPRIGADKAAQT